MIEQLDASQSSGFGTNQTLKPNAVVVISGAYHCHLCRFVHREFCPHSSPVEYSK